MTFTLFVSFLLDNILRCSGSTEENWENYVHTVFLSLAFKDGGKTHNAGQVDLLMTKRGWYLAHCKLWKN